MASRPSLHSQLSSIMETMARSALSQVCKLVDEDSTELRLELSRLMFANSALAEKVSSLECELTIVRSDDPKLCKSYRTVGVQTVCITDGDAHVSDPPTIEGVFGKEWCGELWINRTPFSAERVTDSTATSVKSIATLGDHITMPEIKEEVYAEDSGSSYPQEMSRDEEPERCIAEEPEQLSVGYSVDGSTCSISFDQDVEKDVADGGIEETSIHLISLNDTEGPFSTHIIPIEEDDEVEFIQGQEETADDPNWIDQNKEQTLEENFSVLDKDPLDNSNMVDVGSDREENKVKFSCQICNRIFFHKGTLTHHLKSHKSTYCNICKQHFPRKNKLSTHTCIPPPSSLRVSKSCHVCGKTFANPSALRIHFVVHTGEKPYKCSFCGKGFTQKGNLKCHLRIHTGERPFGCGECGMTFTQKVNLNHHLMAHRNREEKRYQ